MWKQHNVGALLSGKRLESRHIRKAAHALVGERNPVRIVIQRLIRLDRQPPIYKSVANQLRATETRNRMTFIYIQVNTYAGCQRIDMHAAKHAGWTFTAARLCGQYLFDTIKVPVEPPLYGLPAFDRDRLLPPPRRQDLPG